MHRDSPPGSGNWGLTMDSKRTLSQLERPGKAWRTSLSLETSSTTIQRTQHVGPDVSNSTSLSFSSSLQPMHVEYPIIVQYEEVSAMEDVLQALRMKRLNDYKQAVYIPPMAKPNLQASDDTRFILMEKVEEFLVGNGQVMLILGDSGAGKSTFNQYLEYVLWRSYKPGDRIPLFISLPTLERPEKELIAEQLKTCRFSDAQIQELERTRQFILICDGYDESQLNTNLHTTNRLNRFGERDAKLLVTCRTQYLGSDYRDRFVPEAVSEYYRAANHLFQEAVIAPFSEDHIEDYVERYVPLEPRTWVKQDYMDKLTTIPSLMDLVKNPFLLWFCLETLPSVVQGQSDLSRLRVTRVQLYDFFVKQWLGVNKRRLQKQKLSVGDQKALNELMDDGFEQSGIEFQMDLAAAIFTHQDGKPIVDYIPRHDKNSWKAAYFNSESGKVLLRSASLLNRKNLVIEPSIIQFLAERVQLDFHFKHHLLSIIELSKSDDQAARAAANAITILVRAGVRFNGVDLRGIRIPEADLSEGEFDSALLQGSDLTGVTLTKSWLRQADLTGAQMEGVQFGELPYLKQRGRK
ncbi:WD_REPEATS_REGION domain-containing protein [Mortierella sp. 14UC]|nr:WD_REPEATS_REGION domain-containing protein [Mortierella sp. 14UC]